eukprot:1192438-Prorocentrum_minimum.AAC.3
MDLVRCYGGGKTGRTIVFVERKAQADEMASLIGESTGARALHGDIAQATREVYAPSLIPPLVPAPGIFPLPTRHWSGVAHRGEHRHARAAREHRAGHARGIYPLPDPAIGPRFGYIPPPYPPLVPDPGIFPLLARHWSLIRVYSPSLPAVDPAGDPEGVPRRQVQRPHRHRRGGARTGHRRDQL